MSFYIDDRFLYNGCASVIDPENEENFYPLSNLNLGPLGNISIANLQTQQLQLQIPGTKENIEKFRKVCRSFLMILATEIKRRFRFGSPGTEILQHIQFIEPSNICTVKSIACVANFFKLDVVEVDNEYQEFRLHVKNSPRKNDFKSFWNYVESLKNNDKFLFSNIIHLKNLILVLPHSSATCERGFS